MELVFGRDRDVAAWVAARMPIRATFEKFAAIGVAENGCLAAGIVYTNFRRFDIEISFAADTARWATRGIIGALLRYPLVQLGCVRVTTVIGRKNKRARRFNEGLGFRLEGIIRKGYDGRTDACVYGLLKQEAARWLNVTPRFVVNDVGDQAGGKAIPLAEVGLPYPTSEGAPHLNHLCLR